MGDTITINRFPFIVAGIAPPEFSGIYAGSARDLWVPLHALDRLTPDPNRWQATFADWLVIAGRLRPGVSMAQAAAELDLIHRHVLAEQFAVSERPDKQSLARLVAGSHLVLRPAGNGLEIGLRQEYALPLELLLCVAGIVLLVSCANVANLVLARGSHRGREIALRLALGSGRGRIVRQLLTESTLLAGAGGALAVAIAWGAAPLWFA